MVSENLERLSLFRTYNEIKVRHPGQICARYLLSEYGLFMKKGMPVVRRHIGIVMFRVIAAQQGKARHVRRVVVRTVQRVAMEYYQISHPKLDEYLLETSFDDREPF